MLGDALLPLQPRGNSFVNQLREERPKRANGRVKAARRHQLTLRADDGGSAADLVIVRQGSEPDPVNACGGQPARQQQQLHTRRSRPTPLTDPVLGVCAIAGAPGEQAQLASAVDSAPPPAAGADYHEPRFAASYARRAGGSGRVKGARRHQLVLNYTPPVEAPAELTAEELEASMAGDALLRGRISLKTPATAALVQMMLRSTPGWVTRRKTPGTALQQSVGTPVEGVPEKALLRPQTAARQPGTAGGAGSQSRLLATVLRGTPEVEGLERLELPRMPAAAATAKTPAPSAMRAGARSSMKTAERKQLLMDDDGDGDAMDITPAAALAGPGLDGEPQIGGDDDDEEDHDFGGGDMGGWEDYDGLGGGALGGLGRWGGRTPHLAI